MLAEWFQYLTTPCPKHLRALGYPQEIIATQARYRRCKEAWRPHLENTKAFILESASSVKGSGTAVVLGSGMLLDVPLAELAQRFEQVILVDIVHLPWVKRQGKRYSNVRFHALDVTGVCEVLFNQVKQVRSGQGPAPKLPQMLPKPLPQSLGVSSVDFLVSVNLLSQLPILPCAFLERRCPAYSDDDLEVFSEALIANHLLWLKSNSDQVCLIMDLQRRTYGASGEETERENLVGGDVLPQPDRDWIWEVAPHPERHPQMDFRHKVGGFQNLR